MVKGVVDLAAVIELCEILKLVHLSLLQIGRIDE
jgi:hypothetical protein